LSAEIQQGEMAGCLIVPKEFTVYEKIR